jgi:uncharacterized protein with NAD-binding domain and iron-sulfur cluster
VQDLRAPYLQRVVSVAVLGGGVGGLSAAHELAERGFDVTVYEARDCFGGKARSMPVPGSGTGGSPDLPAEHGFRFFPGFYRHLPDTMARIPSPKGPVKAQLTQTSKMLIAQTHGRNELIVPTTTPSSVDDLRQAMDFLWQFGTGLGIAPAELVIFFEKLILLLCSCDERRYQQWEQVSWWDYTGAAKRSPAFQKFLASGLTRTLVAAQAQQISARTGGLILCQLLFGMLELGGRVDNVLTGPTSEVWIDPWIAHLRSLGVTLRNDCTVAGIHCDGKRITGVTIHGAGGSEEITADHYVVALPVERLRELISGALRAAEPRLVALSRLVTRWMNGAMFYLYDDVPVVRGHMIFIDSAWALTAISQQQFWPDFDLKKRGNGRVGGILSVDISDWNEPGRLGKIAMDCTEQEIREEVWYQITEAIRDGSLQDSNIESFFLDPDIQFVNPTEATNLEPLLINTAGSWADRPDAMTRIPNLFLAADFVRTYTDLATMEGANEAARRAVNAILAATNSKARPCRIWKLHEPEVLAPFRALDRVRWQLRLPAILPFRVTRSGGLAPADPVAHGIIRTFRFTTSRW